MKFSKQFQRYESEATLFINGLKKANPNLEQSQRDGRALLWDKAPIDLQSSKDADDAKVDQMPYVYQNKA